MYEDHPVRFNAPLTCAICFQPQIHKKFMKTDPYREGMAIFQMEVIYNIFKVRFSRLKPNIKFFKTEKGKALVKDW